MSSSTSESLEGTISEIARRLSEPERMCAWGGCTKQFTGPTPPRGWVTLTIAGAHNERRCVLCPKHARELDGLLKGIGGAFGDIAGSA